MAEKKDRMPVIFVGHGSPMNGIEDNEFSRAWEKVGRELPRPRAILSISAHWETDGPMATAMERPKTIHDFYGFPHELYAQQYPAPGSPELAREVAHLVQARPDNGWGLDHGTWAVLKRMFPEAEVPVVQLSLDRQATFGQQHTLAQKLAPLREKGVLVLGSGNIVHNLMMADPSAEAYDWANAFDEKVKGLILKGDHRALIHYERLGEAARLSIPTNEHYLPMLYILALKQKDDSVRFFGEGIALASVSMRSFVLS